MEDGIRFLQVDATNGARTVRLRPKHDIIQAQNLYLKTRDERHLQEFYRLIVATGLKIQKAEEKVVQDPEEVLDLASELCIRLMESGKQVIAKAPSAYIKRALFYKNKRPQPYDYLDEMDHSTEDPDSDPYEVMVKDLMEDSNVDESTELGQLVKVTLEASMNWHLVNRELKDKDFKREYRKTLMEIKRNAEESMQGNRMLPTG